MKSLFKNILVSAFILGFSGFYTNAQSQVPATQFFVNPYLTNPAMAATDTGWTLNLAHQQRGENVSGSPKASSITAEYLLKKVGFGFNVLTAKAGIFKQTRALATYAYHLPFNNEEAQFHFGLSLGFSMRRINETAIIGDQDDQMVSQYNQNATSLDGEFGVGYTSNKLTLQASLPGLSALLNEENKYAGQTTLFSSISYKVNLGSELKSTLEPKFGYRVLNGYQNSVDLGANLSFINNTFSLQGIYHSNKDLTLGAVVTYKSNLSLIAMYTSEMAAISGSNAANFQFGLRVQLEK